MSRSQIIDQVLAVIGVTRTECRQDIFCQRISLEQTRARNMKDIVTVSHRHFMEIPVNNRERCTHVRHRKGGSSQTWTVTIS